MKSRNNNLARDFNRIDRISELIQKELSQIIHQMKDPRVKLVTIAAVKLSKDLAYAKIFVSVLAEELAEQNITTLNKAAGFLRTKLAQHIKLRVIPSLLFVYDDTQVRADRLSKLIDSVCHQEPNA